MKQTKITRNKSKGQSKDKPNKWKNKAIYRRKENERLRKRNKELIVSRNGWKKKYQDQQKGTGARSILEGEKAYRHQYSLALIVLVVDLYKYGGMSLRSCRHSLVSVF